MTTPHAFDPLALTYDDAFTHTPIGRYLRGRVQERLNRHFQAGDHVLELGCGTGEDALYLASRGVRVMATDASESMLALTRAKAAGNKLVRVERVDLRELTPPPIPLPVPREGEIFDGVFASFGPLNCLEDWRPLAAWLAEQVKPGGIAAFGVMSPLCLWEPVWHGLHGNWRTAARRWRKNTTFQPLPSPQSQPSEPIAVRYPTIRRLTRAFAPHFRRTHVQGIGLLLPPSDVFGVIEKRPRLLKLLMGLERRFTKYGKLALLADHYWIEFVKELR